MGPVFPQDEELAPGVNLNLSKEAWASVGPKGAKGSSRGRLSVSKGGFRSDLA
jgi:hypothetical protein